MKQWYLGGLLMAVSMGAPAQTRVDLGNQSRNVDFSQASFVRPFPVGGVLPATCQVGQMYFLTAAPAGVNECVSTNVWQPIQVIPGAGAGTLDVKWTSSTVLTIGSQCSIPSPCLFRIGSGVFSMLAPATATVSAGSGLAIIYIDANANLTVGVSTLTTPAVSCAGCIVAGGISQYPLAIIPIEIWNATNGTWDPSGTSNISTLSAAPALVAGDNITITESAGSITIASTGGGSSGGSSGGGGSGSGGGTGSGFDPMDPTQLYRDHLAVASGFNNGPDGWGVTGNCSPGSSAPASATPFTQEGITGATWAQVSGAGNSCNFFFPTGGVGSFDFWSGNTPAKLWLAATYLTSDTNGTHYVGLTTNPNNYSDFIGCRQSGSGDWFAVIRTAGNDVATADTGVPHDTLTHRLTVDNNSGTAATIRCSVDGRNTAVAAGVIPVETFGWAYSFGAIALGAPAANFGPFQYTIFLQGLPRQ